MKTSIKNFLFLILFLIIYLPVQADDKTDATPALNKKPLEGMTITLANGEYAPFFSESFKHYGVVSLIVKEAFAQEGIRVNYVFRPWKRGLKEAAKGKWNGSVGWQKNEERLKTFFYSKPIMKTTTVFFQKKEYPVKWDTASDLKGRKIVLITGFVYGDEIMRAEEDGVISVIRSVEAVHSLKMLIQGRVDLAAVEREVGLNLLFTRFNSGDAALVEPQKINIHSKNLFMVLSRKRPESEELIRLFNSGLKKIERNGKMDRFWQESRRGDYVIKP